MTATPNSPTELPQLPLFPLRSVLFPGGKLPLQIFEVRYLDMIGRCAAAGEPFGVVGLTEGDEIQRPASAGPSGDGYANEAFFEVGTLARIDTLERPQAGLMRIDCSGTQRFRLNRYAKQKYGLWVGDATPISPDPPTALPDDLAHVRVALQRLMHNLRERAEVEAPLRDDDPGWDDCGWLANRWAEILPLSVTHKQRLMTLDSPLLRLELVADALAQLRIAPGSG